MTRWVIRYRWVPEAAPLAITHLPAHRARLEEFHARGDLLAVGVFTPMTEGAMGIFRTREAAEEFMSEDPFVLNGVVRDPQLTEWDDIFAE